MSRLWRLVGLALVGAVLVSSGSCSCGSGNRLVDEAESRYEQGDLHGALVLFEKALEHDPDLHEALYGIGVIQYSWEQHTAALEHLERAVTVAPESADYRMVYGDTLALLGRYDAAIREYETALRLAPSQTRAFYSVGIAYYNKQDYDASVRWLRRYLDAEPRAIDRDQIVAMIRVLED